MSGPRESSTHPGLRVEVSGGTVFTFTHGGAFETYHITAERIQQIDCSDRYTFPKAIAEHVKAYCQAVQKQKAGAPTPTTEAQSQAS